MSTSEPLDRQAVSGAHVNKCSRRKQRTACARGMPMACHTSSRSEDRRPGARSRERRSLRGPAKVLGSRRSALRDARPGALREGNAPHAFLTHESFSAYTTESRV